MSFERYKTNARLVNLPLALLVLGFFQSALIDNRHGLANMGLQGPVTVASAKEYHYTRTRNDPNHLRISEEFKNQYVDEVKYKSRINGTKYEYYKSSMTMSYDELIFETIDKIFQHRLSPFYVHHYDNEDDKRKASDPRLVSHEACARDLMYLVDKLSKRSNLRDQYTNNDEDQLTPELTAFFDSYARHEAGLMMGNTYWVGGYEQCINRHIFELYKQPSGSSGIGERQHFDEQAQHYQQHDSSQVVSFKGRYCISALKSPTWDSIISAKKVRSRSYFKSERQFNDYSKLFRLQVGICLPDSCDSTSLERHADEIKLLTTSMLEARYADYELIDLYCVPDESSPLRAWSGSALTFILLMLVWMILVISATALDLLDNSSSRISAYCSDTLAARGKSKSDKSLKIVEWFSLRANYRKLILVSDEHEHDNKPTSRNTKEVASKSKATDKKENKNESETSGASNEENKIDHHDVDSEKQSQGHGRHQQSGEQQQRQQRQQHVERPVANLKINLRFLNAFKVLVMFWIVNGHIMLLMIQTAKNILSSDALLNGLMHFLIGATFGVDLFFTMTGFLTSYLIFNSGHAYRMRPATWLYLSFHRYWRLAPLYLLTFWFSRSVMQSLGNGPLWDYGTSSLTFRGLCNHESWWYPLTLTSNLHGLFEECMITSWYISCDMQFWLVSPIFIHLLAKSPLSGWMAGLATIVMSSKVRYDAILAEQSARHDELVQPRADIFMRVSHDLPALYTHPHYRIAAYIVGLLAGHYVYMIKSGKWSSSIAAECLDQQQIVAQVTPLKSEKSSSTEKISEKTSQKATIEKKKHSESTIAKSNNSRRNTLAYTGLFLFILMSFASYLLANYFPAPLLKYAKPMSAVAYAIGHLLMSIGASLVIIAMCFGQWSNIIKFLSHPIWTRLSKMNYALLLLQCEAIYYQIFRYDQVPVAGTKELINILLNLLVTLYPLAFAVTLIFEFPLANLEKLLRP